MRNRVQVVAVVLFVVFLAGRCGAAFAQAAGAAGPANPAPARGTLVLDTTGAWRMFHVVKTPEMLAADGPLAPVTLRAVPHYDDRGKLDWTNNHRRMYRDILAPETEPAPADWKTPDFDDSDWPRGTAVRAMRSPYLARLCLRGKFTVTDPAAVKGLSLSLAYRGGAVVHLNGREIARQHLPPGPVRPGQPAQIYPRKAYLNDDGKLVRWTHDRERAAKEVWPLRGRRIDGLAVAPELLRKGTNVLAIEIHAAAYPAECAKLGAGWATAGLLDVCLRADAPDGLVPNVVRPRGVQVWNADLLREIGDIDYGDPHGALRPIVLAGARNGHFTGRVVVSSDRPIVGLSASVGELRGPGGARISPSAVRVRYGVFGSGLPSWLAGLRGYRSGYKYLQTEAAAVDSPPAEVPVPSSRRFHSYAERARQAEGLPPVVEGAVQPVWVTVRVPPDAAAGDYRGTLTIRMSGRAPVAVGVRLTVADWALPDPKDFDTFMGIVQSPEAVAVRYGLALWSAEHWRRIARSFDLIAQLGGDVLVLPLGAESQYGNERSLALWVRQGGGRVADLHRVAKYVDVALKHMGRPTFVVVGVWDGCGRGGIRATRREHPRVSVLDPATGRIGNEDGPMHGTPLSVAFWRPVLKGVREILRKRGLAGAMVLGYGSDTLPKRGVVTAFHEILPETGWQVSRHLPAPKAGLRTHGGTVPVDYETNILGAWTSHDPSCRRVYGWRNGPSPVWMPRPLGDGSPLAMFRVACEQALLAGRPGLGQIGADFWHCWSKRYRWVRSFYGRFPETNEGNAAMRLGQLLWPDADGPVPTPAFEVLRENLQECQARIFLEKRLTATPCPLPPPLAETCQKLLDERTRWHRIRLVGHGGDLAFAASDWQGRSARLYAAAAEAAAAAPTIPAAPNPTAAGPGRDSPPAAGRKR